MDFNNVKDLIAMRDYISNYVSSPKADTKTVNYLNTCLQMIDRKIIGFLSSSEFQKYIGYQEKQAPAPILNFADGQRR